MWRKKKLCLFEFYLQVLCSSLYICLMIYFIFYSFIQRMNWYYYYTLLYSYIIWKKVCKLPKKYQLIVTLQLPYKFVILTLWMRSLNLREVMWFAQTLTRSKYKSLHVKHVFVYHVLNLPLSFPHVTSFSLKIFTN